MLTGAPCQQDDEAQERFTRKYLSDFHQNIGMISFSSQISDPVLWSHYADSHRGIAIGFEVPNTSPQIQQVKYSNDRPAIDFEEAEKLRINGLPTDEFVMKIITEGFSQKAKSWEYEQEYRKFVYLNRCKMVGSHYFEEKISPSYVVLGFRCTITEEDIKRLFAKMSLPIGRKVVRARFDNKRYTLLVPDAFQSAVRLNFQPPASIEANKDISDDDTCSTPLSHIANQSQTPNSGS
jgi:hypothetical protein